MMTTTTMTKRRPLVDLVSDRFITLLDAAGDAAYNRTRTLAQGYGATLQATTTGAVGGRDNVFVMGASAGSGGRRLHDERAEVGSLTPERGVAGSGLLASLHGLGGDDLFNTAIDTGNQGRGAVRQQHAVGDGPLPI